MIPWYHLPYGIQSLRKKNSKKRSIKGNCITERQGVGKHYWRSHFRHLFAGAPALYGQLLDRFNSFFTTSSILFLFFYPFCRSLFLPTEQYTMGLPGFPLSPIWNAILSNTRGQASSKPPLKELKGRREVKKEGVCVKRTNGRFIWALSLYHQLSGSAASIEMELGPGEVHSFIRAESR